MDKLEILEEIKRNNTREWEVVQALEKDNRLSWKQNRIMYMEEMIYIPNNKKLKKKILQENHNSVDVEHPGQQRMIELLKQNYWWPGLKEDVKKSMQGCFKCQQNKVQHQKKLEELYPLKILQEPWQEISINIIEPLPRSNRMDAIVVIMDQFTKMIWLKAITTNISAEGIVKIYRDEIWKLHRVPKKILSDRDPQFASRFI